MKKIILAIVLSTTFTQIFTFSALADSNSLTLGFNITGSGVNALGKISYIPITLPGYGTAWKVTGISGTFTDSVSGITGTMVGVQSASMSYTNLPSATNHGSMSSSFAYPISYDNIIYPGNNSPNTCPEYYNYSGGTLDAFGLLFTVKNSKGQTNIIDLWSNGNLNNASNNLGLDYGIAEGTLNSTGSVNFRGIRYYGDGNIYQSSPTSYTGSGISFLTQTTGFNVSGQGVSIQGAIAYSPITLPGYGTAWKVTDIAGTFTDTVSGISGTMVGIQSASMSYTNLPSATNHGNMSSSFAYPISYDNIIYPGNDSPNACPEYYNYNGGMLDDFGILFNVRSTNGITNVVDIWSNGNLNNSSNNLGLDYGIAEGSFSPSGGTQFQGLRYLGDGNIYQSNPNSYQGSGLSLFTPLNNGFWYAIDGGSISILGYIGTNQNVIVPTTISGLPVTSVGDNAFINHNGITSVTIPNSVVTLGNSAFFGDSNLTSVTIPDSVVNFGTNAFGNSANVQISGSQGLLSYLQSDASALGFTGNALTAIQSGGSESPTGNLDWILNWLVSNDSFISRVASRILSGTNNYGLAVKQNQTLTFPAPNPVTYASNASKIALSATSSAGLSPITFTSANGAVASIVNNTMSVVGAGSTTITASQAGNALWNPVSASHTFVVNPITQTLSFPKIPTQLSVVGQHVTLSATSSAKLNPITYSVANTAIASVSSNVLTILGSGTTTVTATNVGTQNYTPAGAVQNLIVK